MTHAVGLLVDFFWPAAVIALIAAQAIAFAGSRLVRSRRGSDYLLPFSVVAGFLAGYAVLPRSFAALVPQEGQPWQWLPYFAVIAAILSASLSPLSRPAAWILPLVVANCIVAAFFAPKWPIFGLTRQPLHLIVALYLVLVSGPLLYLPRNVRDRWLLPAFAVSSATSALAIGVMVSARLAQLAAIAAAAFASAAIANRWPPKASDRSLRSLIALFSVLTGGTAWLAFVEPDPPQPALLIVPLLPLLLWLLTWRRRTNAVNWPIHPEGF